MARKNKFKQANTGTNPPQTNSKPQHATSSSPALAISKVKLAHSTTKPTTKLMDSPDQNAPTRRKTSAHPWPDGDQPPQFHPQPTDRAAPHSQPVPIPSTTPLLPPDILALSPNYDIHTLAITSGAAMHAKVSRLLTLLENGFSLATTGQKPGVVALVAKANAATKLVGVVEIAKRELEGAGLRWWQYSGVGARVEERSEREGGGKSGGKGVEDAQKEEEEEEEAFERMVEKERVRVRTVPVLTIYMSRVPVPELKGRYGEQTSGA